MISSGAHVSRYLIQSVIGHYTKGVSGTLCLSSSKTNKSQGNIVKHIRGSWCRSMKYTAFAHFVNLGATRYGADVDILKGGGDAAIIESYISAKTSSNHHMNPENLDERWLKVREIFEKFHFIPFDDKVCRHVVAFA